MPCLPLNVPSGWRWFWRRLLFQCDTGARQPSRLRGMRRERAIFPRWGGAQGLRRWDGSKRRPEGSPRGTCTMKSLMDRNLDWRCGPIAERGARILAPRQSVNYSSSAQGEDHVHSGLHGNRLVVEHVGLVSPVAHRIQRSLPQHVRSAYNMQTVDRSGL